VSNINIQYRNVFVHVPKTAGVSMERIRFVGGSAHQNFHFLTHDPNFDPNFFTWAFVRNPYTRLASAYYYVKSRHKQLYSDFCIDPDSNFENFIFHLDKNVLPEYFNESIELAKGITHFYPQSYFLKSDEYKLDFIGKFENIKQDWKYVVKRIEMKADKRGQLRDTLPHSNKTSAQKRDYMSEYTPEMKERVYDIYREDFEMFGYTK
jgi:hypothetical protein